MLTDGTLTQENQLRQYVETSLFARNAFPGEISFFVVNFDVAEHIKKRVWPVNFTITNFQLTYGQGRDTEH